MNRKNQKEYVQTFTNLTSRSPHEWSVVFRMAFRNLRMNKMRTALTTIGIIIGIMSVIVVMAGGAALKDFVLGQVAAFGSDYIQVEVKVPGTGATSLANAAGRATGVAITTLKEEDAKAVAKLPNVAAWAAGNMDQELVAYKDTTKRVILFGVSPTWPRIDAQATINEGNFFSDGENNALDQVVVIGSGVRDSFFGLEDPVGKNIKIKGQSYRVIGVEKKRGSASFISFDDAIFVPVNTLNKKLLGINYFQFVTFKVADQARMEQTALDIRAIMDKQHKTTDPDKEDFSVVSATEGMQILNSVFGTINYLLLALTSISLVVGGVGIMNVMYVAVTERTREIGLRKARAAPTTEVLRQFLFEELVVTFLGGVIGIALGVGVTFLLNRLIANFGYNLIFMIPPQSILIAVGFSFFTGIIFGIYPARKASLLSPLEALRK